MNKRKSVGRRRSRSICGWKAKDFCQNIPKDLPESERLMKLIEMSYKFALKETIKESKIKENFNLSSVLEKGEENLEKAKATIIENNLLKSAVENEGQDECRKESQIYEDIKLYEEEIEKWCNLTSTGRESLQNEINIKSSYSINVSQFEKINDYNYDDIMKETSILDGKLWEKISTFSEANEFVKSNLEISKSYENKLKRDCENYYHLKSNRPGTLHKKTVRRYI